MLPTHFVVEDKELLDSNTGTAGGVVMRYTGTCRLHPWASREGEMVMDGDGIATLENGDVYEGETRLGMFDGNGKMHYANGDVYDGQWQNHLWHGYGVLDVMAGPHKGTYIGLFKGGEKDGMGEETRSGSNFVGLFRHGKRNGIGRAVLNNGGVIDGVFVDDKMHGVCTVTYANGDIFEGPFHHGVPHGKGEYTEADTGNKFEELFECGVCVRGVLNDDDPEILPPQEQPVLTEDEQHERKEQVDAVKAKGPKDARCFVTYGESGDRYEGDWHRTATGSDRRGIPHGFGKMITKATGNVFEGDFINGVREGRGTVFFADYFKLEKVKEVRRQLALQTQQSYRYSSPKEDSDDVDSATTNGEQRKVVVLDEDVDEIESFWFEKQRRTVFEERQKQQESPSFDAFTLQDADIVFPLFIECDFHNDLLHGKGEVHLSDGTVIEEFYAKDQQHGISHSHPGHPNYSGEIRSAMYKRGAAGEVDYHLRPDHNDDNSLAAGAVGDDDDGVDHSGENDPKIHKVVEELPME